MSNGSEHIKEPAETVMSDAEKAWEAFWWSDATPVIGTREGFIAGYASRDQEVAALDAALWVAKESQRELEAERDALLAVIEKVRRLDELSSAPDWPGWNAQDSVWSIIRAVPSGVLATRDFTKWDEGYEAGYSDGQEEYYPGHTKNPYRAGKDENQ